jgi:oxygen-independent coproporphyrinogen-3 oxidase
MVSPENTLNSLYIHFPYCKHLCNYCDFYKTKTSEFTSYDQFHQNLRNSWEIHENFLKNNQVQWGPLETIFIGGGTPSLWGEEGARFLKNFFSEKGVKLGSDIEFTIEMNPGSFGQRMIEAWMDTGANRFSLGVQSLSEGFLKALDRIHSVNEVRSSLSVMKSLGVNFSVDLMLGLPFSIEKGRDVLAELEEILQYNPSHLSLYILTTKGNYCWRDEIPPEEWVAEEYLKVSNFLVKNGFKHYEVSNFSKPGKESRHNMRYWRGDNVGALGPSATGFLNLGDKAVRYKWKTNSLTLDLEALGRAELRIEELFLAFRLKEGISVSKLFPDKPAKEAFLKFAHSWERDGLAEVLEGATKVKLTSKGFLLMDSLLGQVLRNVEND